MEKENKNIVLEEERRGYDKLCAASDTLDGKLQNLLNFLSIIFSIAASIEISTLQSQVGMAFWYFLLAALVLYLLSFVVIMIGLNPYKYFLPLSDNWNEIATRYFQSSENEILSLFINEHRKKMIEIEAGNKPKVFAIRASSSLMAIMILLLALAVPFGLINPHPTLIEFFKVKP